MKINPTYSSYQKVLCGIIFWAKIYILLAVQQCAPKVRSRYYGWKLLKDVYSLAASHNPLGN